MTPDIRLYPVFPTPILVASQIINTELLCEVLNYTKSIVTFESEHNANTLHSKLFLHNDFLAAPQVFDLLLNAVDHFGQILLGEKLDWSIAGLWYNRITSGGAQHLHNHANSIISGIVYLTDCDGASTTIFHKSNGCQDPIMRNDNDLVEHNQYTASQWRLANSKAGDLLLFPSQMLHSVPINKGGERETLAFNALPRSINCNGYSMRFFD